MQLSATNKPSILLSILNTLDIGVFITALDGKPLWANKASLSMIGCSKRYLFSRDIYALEKEGIFSPSVSRYVIEHRKPVSAVHHYRGKDYLMSGRLVSLEGSEPDAVLVQAYNISDSVSSSVEFRKTEELLNYAMQELRRLQSGQQQEESASHFSSQSPAYRSCLELAERAALVDTTVLLTGETGVGKGWFANRIHTLSPRHDKPMISINCAAVPASLMESELFGYVKGAFTGASREGRAGYVSLAEGGTLFLDEIGELPPELQPKLLHLLQERSYRPIGGPEKKANIRVIAATNANLEDMVRQGRFRADLFYRLNILPVHIPSLRERREDVLPLAKFMLNRFNNRYRKNMSFSPGALKAIFRHPWPGNIREMENVIERMMITCAGSEITAEDLQLDPPAVPGTAPAMADRKQDDMSLVDMVAEFESETIRHTLQECGSTRKAADRLGVTQSWLMRRIRKYSIATGS